MKLIPLLLPRMSLTTAHPGFAGNPFVGHWGLTTPEGRAGWMGIEEVEGKLTGDDSQPGPNMVQGDHTHIDYRSMVICPVMIGKGVAGLECY